MKFKTLGLTAALALTMGAPAYAQTEIQWWHAMRALRRFPWNLTSHSPNQMAGAVRLFPLLCRGEMPSGGTGS